MPEQRNRLARIFGRVNHADLPALSAHVQEIVTRIDSRTATVEDLAEIILRDFSLTNKILQIVNSPYYCRLKPISSVSRAVATLGVQPVRELAIAIGVFEDFLKAGLEKESISKLLAMSFVSAELARTLCFEKRLSMSAEEAFVCALLHNLGRIVILVYLPDLYREIEKKTAAGQQEEEAVRLVLEDLSFYEVGQEIARFWNFPESIIATMTEKPRKPLNQDDAEACLQVLVVFCNRFVRSISYGPDPLALIEIYGRVLKVGRAEMIEFALASVEKTAAMTSISRFGLVRLKLRSKLLRLQRNLSKKDRSRNSSAA